MQHNEMIAKFQAKIGDIQTEHDCALYKLRRCRGNEILNNQKSSVNDGFMMSIFNEYLLELPPFEEYWKVTFEKKQMSVVTRSRKDGTKVVHMALLRKELYSPMTPTNIKTRDMVV